MLKYVNCVLCNSNNTELLYTKSSRNIVRCRRCGLIYVNPRSDNLSLEQSYDKDYFNYYNRIKTHQLKTFRKRLENIEKYRKLGKILDVGCALGTFLKVAQEKGWEAYGVEISSYATDYIRKELIMNVYKGKLSEACFGNKFFDVVNLEGILEHTPNPMHELSEVYRILKRGGLVAIRTPNIASLFAKILGSKWPQLKPNEHIYYFSPRIMKKMLEKSGFKVIAIKSQGIWCDFKLLANRYERYFSNSNYIYKILNYLARRPRLGSVLFPLNLGDEMKIYGQKIG